MIKQPVSNPAKTTVTAGTSHAGPGREQTGPAEQAARRAEALQDRIAQRAYELYEQRGRQEGQDLEDWLEAERELVGVSGQA